MYKDAQNYVKVRRRVANLYKEHEKELVEVQLESLQQSFYIGKTIKKKF